MSKDIVELLHGSYRNPKDGVVVVSPRLLVKAAKEIEDLRKSATGYQYAPEDLPEVEQGDPRVLESGSKCYSIQSGKWFMEYVTPAWDEDGDSNIEQVDETIRCWIAYRNWLAENPPEKTPQEDQHV